MSSFTTIDTVMHGVPGITAGFVVAGEKTALIETGPKSRVDTLLAGLQEHGIEDLDWIVLTHIHLDHAGAAGTVARRFPRARVAVHERGAPHLVDPSKLWSSATRIYGNDMERLWGGIDPLPEDRIEALADGDKVDLGGRTLQALETPGHARHHHAFLDDATNMIFVGDALGVRLPDAGILRPATPPPEFNLEEAVASIGRIRDLHPDRVCLTHFGPSDEGKNPRSVVEVCEEAAEVLVRWGGWVTEARRSSRDLDDVVEFVSERSRRETERAIGPEGVARMEQTTSYRMNTSGYMRYLDKLEAT